MFSLYSSPEVATQNSWPTIDALVGPPVHVSTDQKLMADPLVEAKSHSAGRPQIREKETTPHDSREGFRIT